jgi:hypothetical protein
LLEAADNDEWMLLHDFSRALRPHLDNLPQRLHATQPLRPGWKRIFGPDWPELPRVRRPGSTHCPSMQRADYARSLGRSISTAPGSSSAH